VNKFSNH